MGDDLEKKQEELKQLQTELQTSGLSRRKFLNRLQALGIGFGAAFVLGVRNADALGHPDGVNLTSTNEALDNIIAEGRDGDPAEELDADGNPVQTAQYGYGRYNRYYRRYSRYNRYYRRYNRYNRYNRYSRYNRYYRRYNRYNRYNRYSRGYRRYNRYY